MNARTRTLAVVLGCLSLFLVPAAARAEEVVTITKAGFSPNLRGFPTNAFGEATIKSTTGPVPSPITHVNVFGPAGVTLDLKGTTTCTEHALEERAAEGCPATSRAGFGGGMGVYQLGKELVHEKYTIDLFLSNNKPGHVELLVFLSGHSPVIVEKVFPGVVVKDKPPYGLGFSIKVPLIKVLPEASNASAESAFISLGAHNVVYYRKVHGKRTRFHVRGIILPKRCPKAGWPVKSEFEFEDGEHKTATRTIACPKH
jgi:hypothetical protein